MDSCSRRHAYHIRRIRLRLHQRDKRCAQIRMLVLPASHEQHGFAPLLEPPVRGHTDDGRARGTNVGIPRTGQSALRPLYAHVHLT